MTVATAGRLLLPLMFPTLRCRSRLRTRGLIAALVAVGCASEPETIPTPHEVRYVLTWRARPSGEHAGPSERVLVNDRGFTIHITRGYLVTRSVELVECPKTATRRWVDSARAALPFV